MESSHSSPSQQVPQLKDISSYDITLDPYLEIVEQPQNRFRFRYRSELNVPHGCIFGESYISTNIDIHPMVQLLNYEGKATIRCGLAQIDNEEDHPHKIGEGDQYERISAIVPEEGSYRVAFPGLTVIHTPRRDVENLLAKAYCRDNNIENVTPEIRRQCKIDAKRINLNIVRLKFSAHDVNTGAEICPPAFSQAINNLKSAATNNLRICRMSRMYGSPRGGDDVFILVEKVSRNDIQVRFFELSKGGEELWSANGRFSRCDVHYQHAIVFSTPPYWDTNITIDVRVHIQLVRPSDNSVSNSMDFTYRGTPHAINRNPGTSSNYSWYEEYRTEYRYLFELPEGGPEQSSSEQSTSTSSLQFSLHNFNRMQIEYEVYCKRNNLMPFNFTGHEELPMEIEPTEKTLQTLETVFSPLVMDKMMHTVLKLFNDLKYLKKPIEIDNTQFTKIRGTLEEIFETTLTNGEKFLHMMMLEDLPCFFKHTIKLIISVNLSHLLNQGNKRGQTILHLTTFNNLSFLIPFLIREGCDPMIGDLAGNTALHYAVMYRGALKILLKTLKHFKVKYDLNAYNEEKRTPLHLVALRGSLSATYLLLEEGACVNTPDASGRTPLHLAVARDSPPLVATILRHSKLVDVDAVDGTGYTALHIACENNKHPNIVKVLLKYNADPMKKVHNQTAWKMASKPIRNFMQKYTEKTEASEDASDEETSEEPVDHSCKETRLIDDYVNINMSCDH